MLFRLVRDNGIDVVSGSVVAMGQRRGPSEDALSLRVIISHAR